MTRHPSAVPNETDAQRARRRALSTARAVTLGLALAAGTAGCETVTGAYCDVFSDTQMCCSRAPGRVWNETTHRCDHMMPVVGPIVAPA